MQKTSGRPKSSRKLSEYLEIRVGETEKQAFKEASELAGLTLSAWIRERLRKAAIRELEGAGRRVPFIQSVPLGDSND